MSRMIVCVAAVLTMSQLCVADFGTQPNLGTKKLPSSVRLMSSAKEQLLRSQLPQVDSEEIQRLLDDPAVVFYSDAEIPPAYQDWSSGLPGVHTPEYNISANRIWKSSWNKSR